MIADLGLVKMTPSLAIANPIYQEVIPRALNNRIEVFIAAEYTTWLDNEGKLDWNIIWERFLEFWREHGSPLMKAAPYHEIAPHLVLMAYLQRIANTRGEIIREYAIGRGRMDLLVKWPYEKENYRLIQKEAIELKVWKPGQKDPLEKGLEQLDKYLLGLSLDHGTLVIFDRREEQKSPGMQTTREFRTYNGKQIQVIRA